MHRRDISAALLATTAGAALLSKRAQAQSCPALCYPKTPAETAAGVSVVNSQYPPLCVDRYGTNSTPPGGVDMSGAFNAAIKAAMYSMVWTPPPPTGGTFNYSTGYNTVTWGATAPYLVSSTINATYGGIGGSYAGDGNLTGLVLQNLGGHAEDAGNGIVAAHSLNAVFDCTGNDYVVFKDVVIHTASGYSPKTAILLARNTYEGGSITHLERCNIIGAFSVAVIYNYGAEGGVYLSNYLENRYTGANSSVAVFTANNVFRLTSLSTDVYGNPVSLPPTGTSLSTTEHNWIGNQVVNTAGTSSSDCIYLEGTQAFRSYGGYGFNANTNSYTNGRALFYINAFDQGTNYLTIDGFDGDTSSHSGTLNQQSYGIYVVSGSAQTHLGWNIRGCRFPNTVAAFWADDFETFDECVIDFIAEVEGTAVGNGISIGGTFQNSTLNLNNMKLAIGTSSTNNRVSGFTENWNIAARSADYWIDQGSVNATATVGTSSGISGTGLTTQSRLCLSGRCLYFQVLLYATGGNLSIVAGSQISLVAPGGQRLNLVQAGTCTIIDQTSGTCNGGSITSVSGGLVIVIPVAVTSSSHTFIVSGTVFLS
jgi:hypothetical protein